MSDSQYASSRVARITDIGFKANVIREDLRKEVGDLTSFYFVPLCFWCWGHFCCYICLNKTSQSYVSIFKQTQTALHCTGWVKPVFYWGKLHLYYKQTLTTLV